MDGTSILPEAPQFRRVLGHFPTGVAVVTAISTEHKPVAIAVSSFTSVSLDPPLVAFLPSKSSTTLPEILAAGTFCANVLGAHQEPYSRAFSAKGGDKFTDIPWRPASSGSPIIDDVIAWIDCDITEVTEAGDHYVVFGRVRELDLASSKPPLVFFRSEYRQLG
ncbi:nitrilotriacetate monooxygenase component B [Gordonia polyisoprenivorans VH2]|uniref:Nitrilotriacetate monooxygenase component B n=1 Tax=Gordonia polyisoprenivorans (strain DSM 44266 / VH2) TaxID=1112204 RepID=H6N4I9_GORPV|nr:flavin reductase family protein [Gordonia polyisoprenivorans]AFA73571.1 nitrilotriacetate monooxygenase component B [Gordonia polyisoprenivorans VH2]